MDYNGLKQCLNHMQGAYCNRKLTEFIISLILFIVDIMIIIIMFGVINAEKAQQLGVILGTMAVSLLANILFCFYNQTYWLYSLQAYFYNLYYLLIVLYICKAYVLKFRKNSNHQKNHKQRIENSQKQQKLIFYIVSISLILLYTAIFIIALIKQAQTSYMEETESNPKTKYCSEVYYLIFDCLCVLGSIIVVFFLYKNHVEQMEKFNDYDGQRGKVQQSLLSEEDLKQKLVYNIKGVRLSNPLKCLWGWIIPNVISQVINLIQSGLLLNASPPNCLLISSQPELSNYIALMFLIFTQYVGFIATIVYTLLIKVFRSRVKIDRTIQFSRQLNVQGNIELFYPSRQEPIQI